MKNLSLLGRVGSEPVKRQSTNGTPFLTFSLGVSEFENGESSTEWWNITDFNLAHENKFHTGDLISIMTNRFKAGHNVYEDKVTKQKKVYLNYYATANIVEIIARKKDTATTVDMPSIPMPTGVTPPPVAQPVAQVSALGTAVQTADDDLPF